MNKSVALLKDSRWARWAVLLFLPLLLLLLLLRLPDLYLKTTFLQIPVLKI
jgi:hypothetical protein